MRYRDTRTITTNGKQRELLYRALETYRQRQHDIALQHRAEGNGIDAARHAGEAQAAALLADVICNHSAH